MNEHRVVVIGSGFGSLTAAKALKPAPVNVTVIARTQHHLFQPLLCQVATGILSEGDVDAMEAVVDRALQAHDDGELTAAEAATAKLFCSEVAARVIDRCLQLHGGYGYINEYPIARLYADNRVTRIYGGTTEVMKMIIAKDMGL